jgi:hypothetical protein
MAKVTSACEWCAKSIHFDTSEVPQTDWWKCKDCANKKRQVVPKDCYNEIKDMLKEGWWVVGKRTTLVEGSMFPGGERPEVHDYVVFTYITSKGNIRGTHSTSSIRGALDDLFSHSWDENQIEKFGFNFIQHIDAITEWEVQADIFK